MTKTDQQLIVQNVLLFVCFSSADEQTWGHKRYLSSALCSGPRWLRPPVTPRSCFSRFRTMVRAQRGWVSGVTPAGTAGRPPLEKHKHTHPCSLTLDVTFLMHKVPLKIPRKKTFLILLQCNMSVSGATSAVWLFQMPLFLCRQGHSDTIETWCINRAEDSIYEYKHTYIFPV